LLLFFTLSFFTEYSILRISFGGRGVRGLHRHITPEYFGLSLIEEKCQLESGSSAIEVDLHTYILHGKFVGCNLKCTGSIIPAAAVPVLRLGRVAPAPDFHSKNARNRIPRFLNPSSSSPCTSFYLIVFVCKLRFSRNVQSVISHLALSRGEPTAPHR